MSTEMAPSPRADLVDRDRVVADLENRLVALDNQIRDVVRALERRGPSLSRLDAEALGAPLRSVAVLADIGLAAIGRQATSTRLPPAPPPRPPLVRLGPGVGFHVDIEA